MRRTALCLLATLAVAPAAAQEARPATAAAGPWDPAQRVAAQREAMQALAFLDHRETLLAVQASPLANYFPYTSRTQPELERIAALKPKVLATMHGSWGVGFLTSRRSLRAPAPAEPR